MDLPRDVNYDSNKLILHSEYNIIQIRVDQGDTPPSSILHVFLFQWSY